MKRARSSVSRYNREVSRTRKEQRAWVRETQGGMRVFGSGGMFMRAIALVRNHLLLLSFAFASVIATMKSFIDAAVEMRNSLVGLGAVADKTGSSFGQAKEAALELASTGLLSVSEAAAGLKNLLVTGLSLPEAVEVMNAFTDAAAFNRQGMLSLGQAVVGATEGFKNQLSRMIDNAGITKNLSNMYEDYAGTINKTAGALSEEEKYEAARVGILKEAAVFQGNANKLIDEYSGSVSRLSVGLFNLKAALGGAVLPVLKEVVDAIIPVVKNMKDYVQHNRDLIELQVEKTVDALGKAFGAVRSVLEPVVKLLWQLKELFLSLLIVSTVGKAIHMLIPLFTRLGGVITRVAQIFKVATIAGGGLAGTLAILSRAAGPIALITTAATALVYVLLKMNRGTEDYIEKLKRENALKMKGERINLDLMKTLRDLTGEQEKYNKEITETEFRLRRLEAAKAEVALLELSKSVEKSREEFKKLSKEVSVEDFYMLAETPLALATIAADRAKKAAKEMWAELVPTIELEKISQVFEIAHGDVKEFEKALSEMTDIFKELDDNFREFQAANKTNSELSEDQIDKVSDAYRTMLNAYKVVINYIKSNLPIPDIEGTKKGLDETSKELEKFYKEMVKARKKFEEEIRKHERDVISDRIGEQKDLRDSILKMREDTIRAIMSLSMNEQQQEKQRIEEQKELVIQAQNERVISQEHALDTIIRLETYLHLKLKDMRSEDLEDIKKYYASIIEGTQAFIDTVFGTYWADKERLKQMRDSQLADIQNSLNREVINHEEATQRKAKIDEEYTRRRQNLENEMRRNLLMTTYQMLADISKATISRIIADKVAAGQITTGMGLLEGLGAGLGLGLLGAGVALFAQKAWGQQDVTPYMPISPEGAGEEERQRRRFGSIARAAVQNITITPTVSIQGENIWIGGGSVEELETGLEELIKNTTQDAVDTGEIDLQGVGPR